MLPARLVLVRHGQSTWNAEGRLQGQADPPLSKLGRREAVALRGLLTGFPAGRVLTSDLRRTRETAAALGHPDAAPNPVWREIDVGEWAGRLLADLPAAAVADRRRACLGGRQGIMRHIYEPGCTSAPAIVCS